MSHVCWAQQPWGSGPTRFCPTLPDDCEHCGGLVCAEHGCQRCSRGRRDAIPSEQARQTVDGWKLESGGYIGEHRHG